MQKIKQDDEVIIIAGKDKGKQGKVLKIIKRKPKKNKKAVSPRVIVEGVNIVKRHTRGNPQQDKPGGIIEKEAPLDVSNVAIFNPDTGKADKVGCKILDKENRKVRIFKSTGEVIDV